MPYVAILARLGKWYDSIIGAPRACFAPLYTSGFSDMPRIVTAPPEGPPNADGSRVAGWWRESDEPGRVVCGLCPRGCSPGPGERGFCFVRQNRDGQLVSTTYGRSTGFCVDPIEKKPLSQFYPGTAVLSFGTAGCNLGCKFCQNWSMSRSRDVDAGCEVAAPETVANAAKQLGCCSVAYTYNDPIVWAEYAIDTARACHAVGVKNVAVTSGYISAEARAAFYRDMDAANVDLKGFGDDFYRRWTGGRLQPVLDTLTYLARETDVWLEITNLLVPGLNDSPDELKRMCAWICEELGPDVPIHFSAFHPDFKVIDRGPTPLATLLLAHGVAREAGLRYVYTGNVSDKQHQSTYCPGCGSQVIERDGYALGTFDVRDSCCGHCGHPIAGRYDAQPGTWGGRRLPVRIAQFARSSGVATASKEPPRKEPAVAATPPSQDGPTPDVPARPELTEQQEDAIFQAAGRRVATAVRAQRPESIESALGQIAQTPLYGSFVSLKSGGQLRSCCGFLGQSLPLSQALDRAAERAAKEDPRFPPISTTELGHLDMEVWLLWGPQPMTARGKDRIKAVTIGKHGLQIARGSARGLLLPGVATDHNLDALGFLQQVCLKAGLPTDAWQQDDTQVMTFEGHAIRGPLSSTVPVDDGPAENGPTDDAPTDFPAGGPTPGEVAALAEFCRSNVLALFQGSTPNYYFPSGYDGGVSGVALTVGQPGAPQTIVCSQLSLRPEMPLQATLSKLAQIAARALRGRRTDPAAVRSAPVGLSVMFDPAMHGAADGAELGGVDPKHRAVLVHEASRSAWVFDPTKTAEELLAEAIEEAGIRTPAGARVASLAVISTDPRVVVAHVPRPQSGPDVRPPGVAGAFYPDTAEEVNAELDKMLSEPSQTQPWPAVMVPHAGWRYSGALAAKVLGRVAIPEQVIILSPKHPKPPGMPPGAEWAVAPHGTWSLPGRDVPSDPELAARLAEGIDGLELDAAAHAREHSIEVLLPILARLAPDTRAVGITIGGPGELESLKRFGSELADVLREMPQRPLLVISSDMNHFADDAENRRLDRLALDAMETLDPDELYRTVRESRISMCGMFPAVIVMEALRQLDGLKRIESVGYATSADASGDTSRVVGYAGVLLG